MTAPTEITCASPTVIREGRAAYCRLCAPAAFPWRMAALESVDRAYDCLEIGKRLLGLTTADNEPLTDLQARRR
jgi:hypothetical protein